MNLRAIVNEYANEAEVYIIMAVAFYFLFGFITVREIYRADEERLGANPFDRMAHVVMFVFLAAWIWPVVWLNQEYNGDQPKNGN